MHDSNRGIFAAAIGIAIVIAFALGAYVTAISYPEQERYQSYSNTNSYQPESSLAVTNASPAPQNRTPCVEPQSETESDLCAQWRAARAAEKSAEWTSWGVLASVVGISFLLWQIMLTREAVADTGRATEAMEESNKIAAAANRAWIEIKPIVEIRPNRDGSIYLKTHGKFKNIGKSVATQVYIMVRFVNGSNGEVVQAHNDLFRTMIKGGGGRTLIPGMAWSGGQTASGVSASHVKWDKDGRAVFGVITIAVYSIEGDSRRRYSRAIWRLHKEGDIMGGGLGLTWDELVSCKITVDPNSYLDCT